MQLALPLSFLHGHQGLQERLYGGTRDLLLVLALRVRERRRAYRPCFEEWKDPFGSRSGATARRGATIRAKEDSDLASENCIFCNTKGEKLVAENALAQAVYDTYPVSPGHVLVIPRRHVATIWDLSEEEYASCFALVRQARAIIEARHGTNAFNVGVNCGVLAGQSVMHAHIHLIPRYRGDVPDPRGGIRNVIPHKAHYERRKP